MITHRRVRLRDIAEVAGVTPSTVSRVLNRAPEAARIPQTTRERVEKIAADLNYVPDQSARGLRTGRGFLVPLLVPDLTGQMVGAFYRAVVNTLAPSGLNVIMGEADTLSADVLRQFSAGSVAGLIVVGDIEAVGDLPLVRVAPTPEQAREATGPVVRVDHAAGGRQAADHLLDLGHRRLAMIRSDQSADLAERDSFVAHATDRGAEVAVVTAHSLAPCAGQDAMAELMGRADRPTAVFGATDTLATGARLWALEHGVGVPDQVSLIGYDDVPLAQAFRPGLTTVRQPVTGLGEQAAQALVGLLDPPTKVRLRPSVRSARTDLLLATEIVVRGSTGPVPA